jgi:predicted oxidoreductase
MSFSSSSTASASSASSASNGPCIIIGGGLAGLVAAHELTKTGQKCIILEQENSKNLGGQAFWSLGGIFLVDTRQQYWMGIQDSIELARRDWMNSAQFDRLEDEDLWAERWANSYVEFAHKGMLDYLNGLGWRCLPTVGWAERGGSSSEAHGNSVPRFHITWGTGPGVVELFEKPVREAEKRGLVEFRFRHRVDEIVKDADGRAVGVRGTVLKADDAERGVLSNREEEGRFEVRGRAVLVASGGIGGNTKLVKETWPATRFHGTVPSFFVNGVPAHVDGRMLKIAESVGARYVNKDRGWHYTEGLINWNSIWPNHGIRVIPGPSSLWLNAKGKRMKPPAIPGCDTIGTLQQILETGYDYSWFILDETILNKEFMLSGSEQNPDLTGKSWLGLLKRLAYGQDPVKKFKEHGEDFVVAKSVPELVVGMNKLRRGGAPELDAAAIEEIIRNRDAQLDNPFTKDGQIMVIQNALKFRGDRLARCAPLHKILDPKHGPLIAVRMNILTRKTLGGLQTNLESQVIREDGNVFPGLYSAGEVAGFGGGGVHGYNALEGTFLTGCIFSGRAAGIAMAKEGLLPKEKSML